MGRSLTGPGNIARSGDTMLGAFNEAKGNDIASASNINLVIATGNLVDITGGNTIISMTLAPGAERVLRFTGSLRLTNSANLPLPGGEDIVTLPGDFATVRGYPAGVVRVVVFTRETGYVQRIGDTLRGTLTLTPGTTVTPPLKYQAGGLTTLTVAHAAEWNGTNLFQTNGSGVRKQLLYTDGDGSALTGFTSNQVTNALGFLPFNPGASPSTLSPTGGLLEVGRYIDFHATANANDFDARIECQPTAGGQGSSVLSISASVLQVNGNNVWTNQTLNNLNQLTNGPGFAVTTNPVFQGVVTIPNGSTSNPGLRFAGAGIDTGIQGMTSGVFALVSGGVQLMTTTSEGIKFRYAGAIPGVGGGRIILERDPAGSNMIGDLIIGVNGDEFRISERNGTQRGVFLNIANCQNNMSSRLLTSLDIPAVSKSSTGYTRDLSGIIIQWGKQANAGVGATFNSFPMTFPTACIGFYTSYDITDQRGSYGSGGNATTSGAYVFTDSCNTWWMAIGY